MCTLALVLDDGNNLTSVRLNPGTLPGSVRQCVLLRNYQGMIQHVGFPMNRLMGSLSSLAK